MPELPEVETVRRGLEAHLVGRRIVSVDARPAALRRPSPRPLAELEGRRVVAVRRVAKYLYVDLDDGACLCLHLGMSGKLLVHPPEEPERPHTHVVLGLDDSNELRFVDPRRFGLVRLHGPGSIADETAHYGIDALDAAFTPRALGALLQQSRAPLKAFLLDQTKVAGLGNIYACEALWRAGLSPRRLACNTPSSRVASLHAAIQEVLHESLAAGGTSFNDYVDALGRPGEALGSMAVFQREGLACPRCQAPVRRIAQAGRSTFYCPRCQR